MDSKEMIAVLLSALIVSAGLWIIIDSVEVDAISDIGTEDNPFVINSATELIQYANNYSNDMNNGHSYYFVLGSDIDLSNVTWAGNASNGYYIFGNLCGKFDGAGHTITANLPENGFYYLFNSTSGTTTICNLVMDSSGSPLSVVCETSGVMITLDNIIIKDFALAWNNDTPFIVFAGADTTFRNCVNEASWNIADYSAVFMAYPTSNNIVITFDHCLNKGTITGDDVALFVGNPTYSNYAEYRIIESYNLGSLIGTQTSSLFSTLNNSTAYAELNEQNVGCNKGIMRVSDFESSEVSISKDSNGNIMVSADESSNVASYVVQLTQYGKWLDGSNNGTILLYVNSSATEIGSPSDVYAAPFLDYETAKSINLNFSDSDLSQTGTGYTYGYLVGDDGGYYVFKSDYDAFNIISKCKASVTFFDKDDNLLGSVDFDISNLQNMPNMPINPYKAFFENTDVYTIEPLDGTRFKDTFKFKVHPGSNYHGNPIVKWAEWNKFVYTTINADDDGYYTISANTDIIIIVDGYIKTTFGISYDLQNVSLSNMPQVVNNGSSFSTTIIVPNGYELSYVHVTMGNDTIDVIDNVIHINLVTNDINIHMNATATDNGSAGPEDNDELPFIPPQSNNSGTDTTTYVAVAAAAAVVAILAVLAVGISKGKL